MSYRRDLTLRATLVLCALVLPGCNIFGWLDRPSGDAANLSRARACFNRGDFTCALQYYALVSDSNTDSREAESAYVIFEREGFKMGSFLTAIGSAGGGQILTSLANQFAASTTANESKRLALYEGYAKTASISDANLRGMVRLAGSLAILSELLAEFAGADHSLSQAEIADDPTTCIANGVCATATPECDGASTIPLGTDTPGLDLDTAGSMVGSASLIKIKAALDEVVYSLGTNELNASGSIASAIDSVSGVLSALTLSNAAEGYCFRQTLLTQGIGT